MRPSLIVQTVVFHESDCGEARELAEELYHLLTRPATDPNGFGSGIPVFSAVDSKVVDLSGADQLVLVPVLGGIAKAACSDEVVKTIEKWLREIGNGHIIVVCKADNWRQADFPKAVKFCPPSMRNQHAAEKVILAVAKSLGLSEDRPTLFVSHAGNSRTDDDAGRIIDYARRDDVARSFFASIHDSIDAESDASILASLGPQTVFVAVRTDGYALSPRCTGEFHWAKRERIPALIIEALKSGELRSDPYGGNGPTMVTSDNPARAVIRTMIEWIRHRFFQIEARRIAAEAGLPNPIIISRPPELFDMSQKELNGVETRFVMHPDPELPARELEILLALRPRVYITTPTTAYRHLRNVTGGPMAPLDGIQVAISLSDSPDVNGIYGFTQHHVKDTITYLARTMISAGAAVAYGGDHRETGYTSLLIGMIEAYNRTASTSQQRLRNYRPADAPLVQAPVEPYHVAYRKDLVQRAILPSPVGGGKCPPAVYQSDMRRLMALDSTAMIVIGGMSTPRFVDKPGYAGRYPGIVEEAWRMLQADKLKPLYVVGGYGGAAGIVAALMRGEPTPEILKSSMWTLNEAYQELTAQLAASGWEALLKMPTSMEDLAATVREKSQLFLEDDTASVRWNGLTVQENHDLFGSRDPVRITGLVLKGLLKIREMAAQDKLRVELVRGDITQAPKASAICVAIYKDAPVVGSGAILDQLLANAVTRAQSSPNVVDIIPTENSSLDADWLLIATLGNLQSPQGTVAQVRAAVKNLVELATRYGFSQLSTVLFGGSAWDELTTLCDAMIDEFRLLPAHSRISLYEIRPDRFTRLRDHLVSRSDVDLTTHVPELERETPQSGAQTFLSVSLVGDELTTRVLPPPATGVGFDFRARLEANDLRSLSAGAGVTGRRAPGREEIDKRRQILASKLLGPSYEKWLRSLSSRPVIIRHDPASAQIPFEVLIGPNEDGIGLHGGITRILALPGIDPKFLTARPPKVGKLELLLVIDPKGDLKAARTEGETVERLMAWNDGVHVIILTGSEATKAAVLSGLQSADVFHYCGHAFFDGSGDDQSGLNLSDGKLTVRDLRKIDEIPRLAFVNACEGGRVRGSAVEDAESQAFAELFLRMGVEAYLGTFWEVTDSGAAEFAGTVYRMLVQGETIGNAVLRGRRDLDQPGMNDWVNYVLYGNGDFRLLREGR